MLSLYRWLGTDPEVAESSRLSLVAPELAAEDADFADAVLMGVQPELIEAVYNGSVQLAQLVLALATYRLSRPRPPQIRIERNGVTVTVDGDAPESVERVLRALEGAGQEAGAETSAGRESGAEPGPGAESSPRQVPRTEPDLSPESRPGREPRTPDAPGPEAAGSGGATCAAPE